MAAKVVKGLISRKIEIENEINELHDVLISVSYLYIHIMNSAPFWYHVPPIFFIGINSECCSKFVYSNKSYRSFLFFVKIIIFFIPDI